MLTKDQLIAGVRKRHEYEIPGVGSLFIVELPQRDIVEFIEDKGDAMSVGIRILTAAVEFADGSKVEPDEAEQVFQGLTVSDFEKLVEKVQEVQKMGVRAFDDVRNDFRGRTDATGTEPQSSEPNSVVPIGDAVSDVAI